MTTQIEMLARVKELSRWAWACDRPGCDGRPHGVFLSPHARAGQLPPEGDWWAWFLRLGRGGGKTRSAAEWVKSRMLAEPKHRVGIIAPDFSVGRDVCIEGESGMLSVIPENRISKWNRSLGQLELTNGSVAQIYGTDKRKDAESLRGAQFHSTWFEELATQAYGDVAWDMATFCLRLGSDPRAVITSTPRPTPLVKKLSADPKIRVTTGSTYENMANLAPAFAARVREKYEGTTLGRQELYGEILDGSDGALWNYDIIARVPEAPTMIRVVIGVDPAGSTKATSDETGIVAVGLGEDGRIYVLADKTGRYSPEQWRAVVASLYRELEADVVAAEGNFGGNLVQANLRNTSVRMPVKLVNASRGKAIRAEPVVSIYEQGRGVHVGVHSKLENEMCEWVPPGRFDQEGESIPASKWSPNALDAMVWAVTELIIKPKRTRSVMRFRP